MPQASALTYKRTRLTGSLSSFPMQNGLFDQALESESPEYLDLGDASLQYWPTAVSRELADGWYGALLDEIPWRQDRLWIAGQVRIVPRLQCWMGDPGTAYGYSGIQLDPEPWSRSVVAIRDRVQDLSGQTFNSVLLNYYRDGQDSVSWHADDEAELGKTPVIASLSLGAQREFQLRHKHEKDIPKRRIVLQHGSLLLMNKNMQNNWLHQIPKTRHSKEGRINLTFRTVCTADPDEA